MRQMVETLRVENYGETVDVFIDPSENGFLDALRTYKTTKNLSSAYNIAEGTNMTERERGIRNFNPSQSYKTQAIFLTSKGKLIPTQLIKLFKESEAANAFLKENIN